MHIDVGIYLKFDKMYPLSSIMTALIFEIMPSWAAYSSTRGVAKANLFSMLEIIFIFRIELLHICEMRAGKQFIP